jgi:hypothetical protein
VNHCLVFFLVYLIGIQWTEALRTTPWLKWCIYIPTTREGSSVRQSHSNGFVCLRLLVGSSLALAQRAESYLGRTSCFCLELTLDLDPPTGINYMAVRTGAWHHTQLIGWDRGSH